MKEWKVSSASIEEAIGGKSITQTDVEVNCAAIVSMPRDNSIMFVMSQRFNCEVVNLLVNIKNSLIIIEPSIEKYFLEIALKNHVVVSSNARLYFAKAISYILACNMEKRKYEEHQMGIVVGENVRIKSNCLIDPNVFIDHDVEIGENVVLKTGVKIRQNVCIGNNVVIGENSVIGAQGFGVERDDDGRNVRIPHIGGVIIGDNVEIGALTSIVSGTIAPTIIEESCFIDDLNHIAHNCSLHRGTMTTGCVEISGSASIGEYGYIAPNSTIRDGVHVGKNCFVGQATSVQKSFGDDVSLVGSPAKEFTRK